MYGLKQSLKNLHKSDNVSDEDLAVIVSFVDTFTTVSLHAAVVGPIVAAIAEKVNQHRHTKTCRKYQTVCRFKMPKLPSYETIIAKPIPKDYTEKTKKKLQEEQRVIFKKVREILDNKAAMEEILFEFPKTEESTVFEARREGLKGLTLS